MNNCQKCKPCCGGHHNKGCEDIEVIVHKTVHCYEPHRHHHKRVRHIVPVVHHQHHHHHKHHEFEVKRKHQQHHKHHEHGKVERDFCKIDKCECRKEHHGKQEYYENQEHYANHGYNEGEKYEQADYGNEFDQRSDMFM